MFSTGQLFFAAIFFVVFVVIIAYSYRRDIKLHRKYYKGSLYILGGFIGGIFGIWLAVWVSKRYGI